MNFKDIKDFSEVIGLDTIDFYGRYIRDDVARDILNATLETNYKVLFRKESARLTSNWSEKDIDWSGEEFFVLTEKNRLLWFTNSEWASFGEVING